VSHPASPIRITRVIARLNIGGPAVHIASLMAGLEPTCFESCLVVGRPDPHEGDMGYLFEEKGLAPPTVIPELGRSLSPVRDLRTLGKLVSLLRRQRPHIVETHTAKAGFVGRLAARLAGVPIVVHVFHGHVFYGYFGHLQTRAYIGVERSLARLSDRILTISAAQKHDIAHVYRIAPVEKVLVVPLGLDLVPFVEAKRNDEGRFRASLGLPDGAPLVGYIGRLAGVKNPGLFVEVARRTLRECPDAHFVMVGDGQLWPEIERRISYLGLGGRVHMVGWQREMPRVYAALSMLVLTSLNEGTPVTAIEALASGVPVVATAVGGLPDVVHGGQTGLLTPPGDVAALASAIESLLRSPEQGEALALAGQQDVLARFGVQRLVSDMSSLYRCLLEERGMRASAR
jgi:glycosyltransferase involved in cell wall biosynthesis